MLKGKAEYWADFKTQIMRRRDNLSDITLDQFVHQAINKRIQVCEPDKKVEERIYMHLALIELIEPSQNDTKFRSQEQVLSEFTKRADYSKNVTSDGDKRKKRLEMLARLKQDKLINMKGAFLRELQKNAQV